MNNIKVIFLFVFTLLFIFINIITLILVGKVFANGPGKPEFNPRWCHTKASKNGT